MGKLLSLAFVGGMGALVGGCVTYPYTSSFAACDSRAGACYRACEDYADEGDYAACHQDCEYEADQCFDSAYGPYSYDGSPYGPAYASPWSGSYGTWYPNSGYAFSFTFIQRSGYRHPSRRYDRDRRDDKGGRYGRGDRDGDRDYRGPGQGGGQGAGGDRPGRRYDRPPSSGGPGSGSGGGSGQGSPPPAGTPPAQPQAAPPPPPPQGAPPPAGQPEPAARPRGGEDRPARTRDGTPKKQPQ